MSTAFLKIIKKVKNNRKLLEHNFLMEYLPETKLSFEAYFSYRSCVSRHNLFIYVKVLKFTYLKENYPFHK